MYRKHVGRALILALMLSGATSMNAQRITRQFKNVPLKTVLAEVEKELQYSIIYKKDEVNEMLLWKKFYLPYWITDCLIPSRAR